LVVVNGKSVNAKLYERQAVNSLLMDILLISNNVIANEAFSSLLPEAVFKVVRDAYQAKTLLETFKFDLCIINCPFEGDIPKGLPILVLSSEPITRSDVYFLQKPFSKAVFQEKIKDIEIGSNQNIILRAKIALMTNLGFTEDQAHHHIGKQSMDTRRSKIEVAKAILSRY
jgi:hypothetical protein